MSILCCVVSFATCASLEQPVASMLFLGATGVGKTQERLKMKFLVSAKASGACPNASTTPASVKPTV